MTAIAVLLLCAAAGAAGGEPDVRTTKALFDDASRDACRSLASNSGLTSSSSVVVRFAGGERTEFFRGPMLETLASVCRAVYTSGASADTAVTLSVDNTVIEYGPAFREGLFRERKTERTVGIDVRIEAVALSSGRVLHVETLRRTIRDTIAVDEIEESSSLTRNIAPAEAPGPSFWERILEPAILTVSSGVAVYLFFTVRS